MQRIYAFLTEFFMSGQETGNLNETALIAVLVVLLLALCISILLARKNHLYSRQGQKDEQIIITNNKEVA